MTKCLNAMVVQSQIITHYEPWELCIFRDSSMMEIYNKCILMRWKEQMQCVIYGEQMLLKSDSYIYIYTYNNADLYLYSVAD